MSAFIPKKGLRQCDILSPYLFVICMEKLSLFIDNKVKIGEWKPLISGRQGPTVSHLLFDDDLLLFISASVSQVQVVNMTINEFCRSL